MELQDAADKATASESCAVCGGPLTPKPAVRFTDASLHACPTCGSWTWLPRATAASQAAIHDNDEYFQHPYFDLRRAAPAQRRRCRDVFARLAPAVDVAALRGEPLLDVGCDAGTFLQIAREEFGIVPIGVDVSRRAVEVARLQRMDVYRCAIEDAPPELTGFRVITAIDLIEHVPDPGAFLRAILRRLRPGGLAYLETPNIRSLVFRFGQALAALTGSRPAGLIERLFPPQHIQFFTAESLRFLAEKTGFEVVGLRTRSLPPSEISASLAALSAIQVLQTGDRVLGTRILLCATLRRPLEGDASRSDL